MKICILDLETTGLDASIHEIIEIGAVVFDSASPSTTTKELSLKVKPERLNVADPNALKINGFRLEDWADAIPLGQALLRLQMLCDARSIFMAYNVTFDWAFIQQAYKTEAMRNPFNYHKLCLMTYAWSKMPSAKSLKLRDMCTLLGIAPEGNIHHALAGAKSAFEVYKKLTSQP
jgi:DNA polymerase-3 subunit epsilon